MKERERERGKRVAVCPLGEMPVYSASWEEEEEEEEVQQPLPPPLLLRLHLSLVILPLFPLPASFEAIARVLVVTAILPPPRLHLVRHPHPLPSTMLLPFGTEKGEVNSTW